MRSSLVHGLACQSRSLVATLLLAAVPLVGGCKGDDGITPSPACTSYLACTAKVDPSSYPMLLQSYGADGVCWKSSAAAAQCTTACAAALEAVSKLPNLPPECNYTPAPDGSLPPPPDAGLLPDLPKIKPGQAVDILLVIDNSGSMEQEQDLLMNQIGSLIEGLRDGTGALPSLHVGVVTSDLGAGNYSLPSCEVSGGDGGKLQNQPRLAGCEAPNDPWISFIENAAINVPGGVATAQGLAGAIKCIGNVGIQGCGFEAQLESARRALDPKLNVNPGFLRADAALLVLFITDEDDCSARNPQLFDPQQQSLTDPLGPLTSYRCFEFGVQCDVNDRNVVGPRTNCVPAFDWLYKVNDYIAFFRQLNRPLALAAITGPLEPVIVGKDGPNPVLKPSCQNQSGFAVPAIRINAVVQAFGGVVGSICQSTFAPTLEAAAALLKAP